MNSPKSSRALERPAIADHLHGLFLQDRQETSHRARLAAAGTSPLCSI